MLWLQYISLFFLEYIFIYLGPSASSENLCDRMCDITDVLSTSVRRVKHGVIYTWRRRVMLSEMDSK